MNHMYITSEAHPSCWKVTTIGKDSKESEELVFTIHGILSMKDLPPFMKMSVGLSIVKCFM